MNNFLFVIAMVVVVNVVGAVLKARAQKAEERRKAEEIARRQRERTAPGAPRPAGAGRPTSAPEIADTPAPRGPIRAGESRPMRDRAESGRFPSGTVATGTGSGGVPGGATATGPAGTPIPIDPSTSMADVLMERRRRQLEELRRRREAGRAAGRGGSKTSSGATPTTPPRQRKKKRSRGRLADRKSLEERSRIEGRGRRSVHDDGRDHATLGTRPATPAPRSVPAAPAKKKAPTAAESAASLLREHEGDEAPHWLRAELRTREQWRRAIILREVLGPPRAFDGGTDVPGLR